MTYTDVAKKGNILGWWHTHPEPNSVEGADPSGGDMNAPASDIGAFKYGALGIIVQKSVVTLFPTATPTVNYQENVRDNVTTATYGPNVKGATNANHFQYGTFNRNVNSVNYWEQ